MDHYEKILNHYENIIAQQARQIEFMQRVLKSGRRNGDPTDLDPAHMRKADPF